MSGVQYSATMKRSFFAWASISSSHWGKNQAEMCFTASRRKPSTPVVSRYHLPQAVTSSRTSWLWKSRSAPIRYEKFPLSSATWSSNFLPSRRYTVFRSPGLRWS